MLKFSGSSYLIWGPKWNLILFINRRQQIRLQMYNIRQDADAIKSPRYHVDIVEQSLLLFTSGDKQLIYIESFDWTHSLSPSSQKKADGTRGENRHSNKHAPRNTRKRNMRSKIWWFTEFCNSHYVSHFAAFFIVVGTKTSVAESYVLHSQKITQCWVKPTMHV